ncbi:cdc42-interacting protein 4 homolog [Anabas testudineus]|uniref:Thyroid hormone receptor interactor 10b n=1 Tax=Anabas testudineus TaxID=64144 RepID=A0A3Q1HMP5_ANATE|nr:cdc42-interacting protein 4 homolog [Anabas testudineus]
MDWGTDLWDQYDVIEKHTQSGLDLVERYIKFVKERTEVEQNYAKQLRNLTKKYTRRGNKEDQDCKFSNHASFQEILNELNDYAGQREVIAENMITRICVDLTKSLQELKQERRTHLADAKKAQQNLDTSFKQLENIKRRFAKEWAEAEKATQQAEKIENELNATRIEVEKVKQHANARTHTAEECRSDYAAQLQKYNKEQNLFYYTEIPNIFNKLQEMDERRIQRLAEGYCQFSDIEKTVQPIISRCLEGISAAGRKIDGKQDSTLFIEQHKSGFERPGDVEFEDYSHGTKSPAHESNLNQHKPRGKLWPFSKKNKMSQAEKQMLAAAEDFSHLPPEQRKKKLHAKIDEITKELQKEQDQSDALEKMKGVYAQNPQMGDPSSLEPQISETAQNIGRLKGELAKYESWLSEAVGGEESSSNINNNTQHSVRAADQSQNIYTEFDDEFEDMESPIGQCTALYTFEGNSEGTISITEGELLTVMEEDKGDGWMRVLRSNGEEGYIPSSYVKLSP